MTPADSRDGALLMLRKALLLARGSRASRGW